MPLTCPRAFDDIAIAGFKKRLFAPRSEKHETSRPIVTAKSRQLLGDPRHYWGESAASGHHEFNDLARLVRALLFLDHSPLSYSIDRLLHRT